MDDDYINIKIEKKLFKKMENRINNSSEEFDTIDQYANYILKEVLDEMDDEDSEEQKMVENELKKLGYI